MNINFSLYQRRWWIEGLVAAVILLIIAVIFTWPVAIHLSEAIPIGIEAPTIALGQLFMAKWTGLVIEEGCSYWNPPFLSPFPGVFAWNEPQPFTCILIWLISKITGYIAAYNIVVILYLVGFGLVGYATCRLLTEDRISALWSGIWLTASAFCLGQICSLNIIATAFPGACLFFSFFCAKTRKAGFFWLAVLCYVLAWFTCKQKVLFLTILLPFTIWPFFSPQWLRWRIIINGLFALIIILLLVLPHTMQQIAYLHAMGFKRDLSGPQLVLNIQSLFLPAQGHWLTTHFLGWENNLNYYSWDIGIIPLFVVMLSIFLGLLKYGFKDSYKRKVIIALISMMALALFLGFGPKFGLVIEDKNYSPYEFLYSIIPGLKFIRNPARFIKFFIFAMAVLSGLSLAHIRSRIKTRSGKLAVTAGLFMLLFAEMWAMPLALVFPEDQMNKHAGATSWLRDNARGGLVLELPMPQRLWPIDLELDAEAMHRMLKHRNPIVNGHASFGPLPFKQLRKALVVDPAGAGQRYLKAYGVRYVLLHKDRMTNEQRISLQKTLGDNIVYSDSQHDIYLLAQRITDLDIREFLPLKAKFKDYPEIGNIYSLHLIKAPLEAILIMPQPDWWLDLSWDSPSGERKTKKVRILGSVILDREESCLYFQLINFPKGAKQAEARLVSSEEVSELAFKKGPASKKLKCIRDYLTP